MEHLLRDIKDTTVGTLSQRITNQLMGLKGLNMKLNDMKNYLQQVQRKLSYPTAVTNGLMLLPQVIDGKLPMNHQITYHLQDIFNLLPDLTNPEFVRSINVNTNDQMLVVYTASLIRSIIALHNLINNKLSNKEAERKETGSGAKKAITAAAATAGAGDEKKDAEKETTGKK